MIKVEKFCENGNKEYEFSDKGIKEYYTNGYLKAIKEMKNYAFFTNEASRDSDSDGKSDYEEVKNKTNPRENNKRKKKEKELER